MPSVLQGSPIEAGRSYVPTIQRLMTPATEQGSQGVMLSGGKYFMWISGLSGERMLLSQEGIGLLSSLLEFCPP